MTIAIIITLGFLKLPINEMRKTKTRRGAGCSFNNLSSRFADIAFISQQPIRRGLFVMLLLSVSRPIAVKSQALWAIYYKERVENPIPGTLGGLFPNINYFYNVASLKSQGVKKFVELNSCIYGDKGLCSLEENKIPTAMGINCKDNTFLYSGGLEGGSPEWKPIGKGALHRALKSAIC